MTKSVLKRTTLKRRTWQLALVATAMLSANPAFAANVARGKAMAERWCKLCHVVGPDQSSAPADGAPSFMWLAKNKPSDAELKTFLISPHPPMPNLSLSRKEIDDVVAYIRSLKTEGSNP